MTEITRILDAIELGDPQAASALLPLVYEELRQLARRKLTQERPGQTLQATALVHEAYLRLIGAEDSRKWHGRAHFYAAAAEAMRRILVENDRRRRRLKHGGERQKVELTDDLIPLESPVEDPMALDEALEALTVVDPQAADFVKLRYFAGLSTEEAGEMMSLSERSAYRTWAFARAWLFRHLAKDD